MSRFSLFLALVMVLSVGNMMPLFAKTAEKARFVKIPVFFVTDRNVIKDKQGNVEFGRDRQYRTICKHDPHIGVAFCVVENNKHKNISGALADLGWKPATSDKTPADNLSLLTDSNYGQSEDTFYANIRKQALSTADREVFVFVPGYMSTLRSGVYEAARFAYYSERPVLLYSWPSAGRLRDYVNDEACIEWSQLHFDRVIDRLTEVGRQSAEQKLKMRLYAHSMGSRLVVRAFPLLKDNSSFAEISLICPDIDDGLFQHYVSKYSNAKGSATARLYLSHRDKMLALSNKIHGKHSRLGQTSLSDKQGNTKGRPDKEHAIVVDADVRTGAHRFETIDVSELDRGGLGHKIPVELVCSLTQTGRPGAEYKLITDASHMQKGSEDGTAGAAIANADYLWVEPLVGPKHPLLNSLKEKIPSRSLWRNKDWTIK